MSGRERRLSAEQEQALAESLALLRQGWPLRVSQFDRASLNDDACQRRRFEAEAGRQSREAAEQARDPDSEEARILREIEDEFDRDDFRDEWKE